MTTPTWTTHSIDTQVALRTAPSGSPRSSAASPRYIRVEVYGLFTMEGVVGV
jgi:hypothetical protein